jgi:hypothetical protein
MRRSFCKKQKIDNKETMLFAELAKLLAATIDAVSYSKTHGYDRRSCTVRLSRNERLLALLAVESLLPTA